MITESAELITLGILVLAILALTIWNLSADLVFFGALSLIMLLDFVPVQKGLSGLSNEGVLTIAALCIVAFAMQETGAIRLIVDSLFGTSSNLIGNGLFIESQGVLLILMIAATA